MLNRTALIGNIRKAENNRKKTFKIWRYSIENPRNGAQVSASWYAK